jgi:hypothetical protein
MGAKIMGYVALLFASALGVSAVAGYFSIVGLMAIFPAAAISILAMGIVLEIAKLVTASWLYQNWERANLLMKIYFVPAVVILSIITSMGIFGFLSKAHIDQGVDSGDATAKIERIDNRIRANDREIARSQKTLDGFDATLDRYTELGYVTRGLDERREQAPEREAMRDIITKAEKENDTLYDERSELSAEVRAFEVEVGPIKYIADLIYEDGRENLEEAVRAVIIMLVLVFDPLAILLVVAANMQLNYATGRRIEFMSLDDVATEAAEELIEPEPEEAPAEQIEAVEKVMEEDKELLAKIGDGDTLNPAERKRFTDLEWLIDKKRKK